MTAEPQRFIVTFWLRSGARIDVPCTSFDYKYRGDELTSYTIKGMQQQPGQPNLVFTNLNEVAAITSTIIETDAEPTESETP